MTNGSMMDSTHSYREAVPVTILIGSIIAWWRLATKLYD